MHEYKTARTLFGFAEFGGWVAVIMGGFIFLGGIGLGGSASSPFSGSALGGYLGALPGLLMMFLGLMWVMMVQIGRATVDTAQMTGQLLANSSEELRLLKAKPKAVAAPAQRSLGDGGAELVAADPVPASQAPQQSAPRPPEVERDMEPVLSRRPAPAQLAYNGKTIRTEDGGAFVGLLRFDDVEAAKVFIDEKIIPSERAGGM